MRIHTSITFTGALALLLLAGCATSQKPVVLTSADPNCSACNEAEHMGMLQVYSARPLADTDINFEEFFANDDFGGNRFPHEPAHSDYSIYTADGKFFQHVYNARNEDDPRPAMVTLMPGTYNVRVLAKDADPDAYPATIQVTIRAGETTRVFVDGDLHLNASR